MSKRTHFNDVYTCCIFQLLILTFLCCETEYATVGYVEKRIRLRKTQYQMMQKLVESRKKTVTVALEAEMEHAPRQTVRYTTLYWRIAFFTTCYYCLLTPMGMIQLRWNDEYEWMANLIHQLASRS